MTAVALNRTKTYFLDFEPGFEMPVASTSRRRAAGVELVSQGSIMVGLSHHVVNLCRWRGHYSDAASSAKTLGPSKFDEVANGLPGTAADKTN